jgi:hypothetical protein
LTPISLDEDPSTMPIVTYRVMVVAEDSDSQFLFGYDPCCSMD